MKRLLVGLVALASALGLATVTLAADPPPPPIPLVSPDSPQQVGVGEGLWTFSQRMCAVDFNDYYHAVQAMNPWYTVGVHPGTPLAVPDCPVRFSRVVPSTTTTVAPSTTTTTPGTTSTSTTSTSSPSTSSSTTVSPTSTTTTTSPSPTTTSTTTAPTTSTLPAGCSALPGQPGSSDGQGGCFPSAASTGPNAAESSMAAYTGPCTITTPTTIDSKVIRCEAMIVRATLTIRNSYIHSYVTNDPENGGTGAQFTISDSIVNGAESDGYACVNCGVDAQNFTVLRTEIINTNRGVYCHSTCTIQDSYIHAINLRPIASNLAHASAVRVEQHTRLTHNTLACDYTGPFPNSEIGCSADQTGYPDFAPIYDNQMVNNLYRANPIGSGFCAYGGNTQGKPHSGDSLNATNVVFRNNVFERGPNRVQDSEIPQSQWGAPGVCGKYGPVTDFAAGRTGNVFANAGNVWSNGGQVPPG